MIDTYTKLEDHRRDMTSSRNDRSGRACVECRGEIV